MTFLPYSFPGSLYLFSFTQKPAECVRGFLSLLPNSPSPEGLRDLGLSKATHARLPTCSPGGMAWEHPRQTLGPFTPSFGAKADSSQKRGESGSIGFSLFARSLRAHKSCKPHLTLERHLIYAVLASLYEVLS